jgi:hypothetical protein
MGTVAFEMNFCMVHNRDSKMPLVCIHPRKQSLEIIGLMIRPKYILHGQDLRLTQ